MGRAEETEAHVIEAFRLSPADAVTFIWNHIRGLAKLHLGADEEAVAWFRRSIDASRNYPLNHFYSAAALAHLGRLDKREPRSKPGWRWRQNSRSLDFAARPRATTRPTSPSASASSRASAKPKSQRNDRPSARRKLDDEIVGGPRHRYPGGDVERVDGGADADPRAGAKAT